MVFEREWPLVLGVVSVGLYEASVFSLSDTVSLLLIEVGKS